MKVNNKETRSDAATSEQVKITSIYQSKDVSFINHSIKHGLIQAPTKFGLFLSIANQSLSKNSINIKNGGYTNA